MAKPPPRLFVTMPLSAGNAVPLAREQAHYLGTVLRLVPGADVLLFNGKDGEWRAEIAEISRKGAAVVPHELTRSQTAGPDITLLFAPLKKGPTDLIIQKGTELGVRHLRPVLTARTQSGRVPLDRFTAIATEAAEQCERLDIPAIHEVEKLDRVLEELGNTSIIFADEAGDDPDARWGGEAGRARPFLAALSGDGISRDGPWAILIGPEGGFTPEERETLRAAPGVVPVSLGPRILKAETAALVALTLWQAALGDLG